MPASCNIIANGPCLLPLLRSSTASLRLFNITENVLRALNPKIKVMFGIQIVKGSSLLHEVSLRTLEKSKCSVKGVSTMHSQ